MRVEMRHVAWGQKMSTVQQPYAVQLAGRPPHPGLFDKVFRATLAEQCPRRWTVYCFVVLEQREEGLDGVAQCIFSRHRDSAVGVLVLFCIFKRLMRRDHC